MSKSSTFLWVFGVMLVGFVMGVGAAGPPGNYTTPTATLPLYGAGIQGKTDQALEDRLNRMESKLDELLKLIKEALADPPAADPAANGQVINTLSSAATICSQCHDLGKSEQKGGGFTLFTKEGAFSSLTERQKQQIIKRLSTDDPGFRMPPPKSGVSLTNDERAALLAAFQTK